MYKKYMAVTITYSDSDFLTGAHVYYSDETDGLELYHKISIEEGMNELRKLEKILGKPAKLIANHYNRTIFYKELAGYIDT